MNPARAFAHSQPKEQIVQMPPTLLHFPIQTDKISLITSERKAHRKHFDEETCGNTICEFESFAARTL